MTKDKSFYRAFFSLTIMMALHNVIVCCVSLADNVMLGAFSEEALAGVALANQIQFILQMLTMGIGEGIMVLTAQYWGKRDVESIRRIMAIGLKIGLIASAILWGIIFFFPEQTLGLFTDNSAVIAEGVKYLKVICFSYPFFAMTNICICTMRSVEAGKIGFFISLSTLAVNVCLNYILIYGNFGAPRLGATGAAIATLTARVVELCIMIFYLKVVDKKICMTLKALFHFDKALFVDYIRTGIPVILSNTMWGVAMAVQTAILGHLGSQPIAANSIAATIFQILTVVSYGGASASSVLIGKTIGEGRVDLIRGYAKTLQVLYVFIGIVTGVGLFLIKDPILSFYTISADTKALALQFITVLSITVVGTAYQCPALTGIVRGGGDTKFVLYNDTIFMWLVVIPLSALAAFVFHWSPVAVFACLKCDQILKCVVAFIKVNRYKWIRQLTKEA